MAGGEFVRVSVECACQRKFIVELPRLNGKEGVKLHKVCDACHRSIGIIRTKDSVWFDYNPNTDKKGNLKLTSF